MPSEILTQLVEAKRLSDQGRYAAKNSLLAQLIRQRPGDFSVQADGRIASVTHRPSNFRIHMLSVAVPTEAIRAGWSASAKSAAELAKRVATRFFGLKMKTAGLPSDAEVWLNPETDDVHVSLDTRMDAETVRSVATKFAGATIVPHGIVPNAYPAVGWLAVKQAGDPILMAIAQLTNFQKGPANTSLAGPSPLAAALAGGLLGSGLGYGLGALGAAVLPEKYFDKSVLRRNATLLGAGLGASPGLIWALTNYQADPKHHGTLASLLSSWPHGAEEAATGQAKAAADQGLLAAATVPAIPRDAFGAAVWQDPMTPFGIRAATTGLVDAASYASGRSVLSPWDIAKVTATGAATGLVVGKTLGALAGLRPEAQNTLQQAGIWGSILSAVVPNAFPMPR